MTALTSSHRPYLLGVAGGSGSGKTYFARALQQRLGPELCQIVYQDNFYKDQSARFDHDGGAVNFDEPGSIDFEALATCLGQLREGRSTRIPQYNFANHKRLSETLPVEPKPLLIVDGILIFHSREVRDLFDERVFFDTPETLRFQRRLERDVQERNREPAGVIQQFQTQVKPMHDQFVEPSKVFAHTVVRDVGEFPTSLEEFAQRLRARVPAQATPARVSSR
jgi:uridine kinase